MSTVLPVLLKATVKYRNDDRLNKLGHEMFRMYTEIGFPPDMFLEQLDKIYILTTLEKVYVTSVYQTDFLEHRRKSGVQDKNLEKIRRQNREDIERLVTTGELGIY